MNIESTAGSNTDVELRRIQADFEIRQAELKEKQAQRQYEFEERQAQRQAEERRHAVDAELKRLEIDNAAGHGVRFTGAQATVAAAAIALLSGLIGGAIQAWQSGNVEQIKSAGLIASEQKKAEGLVAIEQRKADANIALEQQKFVASLVAKATETPDRDEQIRNLKFYVNAGFIGDPYAEKIRKMDPDEYPSSTPPGFVTSSTNEATSRLTQILGPPSKNIGPSCGLVDNEALKSLLATDKVGPFTVTMLRLALISLKDIFAEMQKNDPDVLKNVVTQGALCVRNVRGSAGLSSHSFGTAIDLNFDGATASSVVSSGPISKQLRAVPFFERAGWLWGGTRDPMHFEVGLPLIEKWNASGELHPK